jgi:hypothetical protein
MDSVGGKTVYRTLAGSRRAIGDVPMAVKNYFGTTRSEARRLDVVSAVVVLMVAIALFPLRFFVSSVFVDTVPVVVGGTSALYLAIDYFREGETSVHEPSLSRGLPRVMRSGTVVGIAAMVLVGTVTGGRTVVFLTVATLVGMLLFVQILFVRDQELHPASVLGQVVLFALVVRGVALFSTPGLVGVDSWEHIYQYADAIRSSGHLSAIAESKYYSAPFYHLLTVVSADTLGVTLRTGLYLTLGVVVPLATVLLYYATRQFLDVRWALFATATVAIADHVVLWGIHLIPTSMGLVFFLGVFYGISKIYTTDRELTMYAFVLALGVATVLTHQISTFVLLLFLGVGAGTQLLFQYFFPRLRSGVTYEPDEHINFIGLFVVVFPLTLLNWSLGPRQGTSFLEGMIDFARAELATAEFLDLASAASIESGAVRALATDIPLWVGLHDALGFLVFLSVTLAGTFALLRHDRLKPLPLTWIVATGLILLFTLGGPLFGLYFLVPGRWYAFVFVPMALLGTYGIRYFSTSLSVRQFAVVALVFVLLFTGPMLTNNSATPDNPVVDEAHHQFAYSESELAAAETIPEIAPAGVTVRADDPYYLLLRDWKEATVGPLEVTQSGEIRGDHVVYRRAQQYSGTQIAFGGTWVRAQLERDTVCRPTMDVLYTNGNVWYCSAP